jgi:dienelactone hydrolase
MVCAAASFLLLVLPTLPQERPVLEGRSPCRPLRPSADPALQALLDAYAFREPDFAWSLREIGRGERSSVHWLKYPSAVKGANPESDVVWARFWEPRATPAGGPAAILLHWLGGSFDMLEVIGRRLADRGIPTLMPYLPGYGPRGPADGPARGLKLTRRDLDQAISTLRQSVFDVRRAGDWLAARPNVDPSRVGVVGISLGAIVGALALGVDDRLGRSVLLIGGGDLPSIIFHGSRETAAARDRLVEEGYSVPQLRDLWKGVEPLTFASRVRPEDVLFLNAESDEVIPRDSTLKLHAAMGRPELRWFKGGHYALLLRLAPSLDDIARHLEGRSAY